MFRATDLTDLIAEAPDLGISGSSELSIVEVPADVRTGVA